MKIKRLKIKLYMVVLIFLLGSQLDMHMLHAKKGDTKLQLFDEAVLLNLSLKDGYIRPKSFSSGFIGKVFWGMAGNVVLSYAGVRIGYSLGNNKGDLDGILESFLGLAGGSVLGSTTGVYLAGNVNGEKGSFGKTLLGTFVGEGAAILVALISKNPEISLAAFIVLPPVFATIFYNRSVQSAYSSSYALLNFKKGRLKLGVPLVNFQPVGGFTKMLKPRLRVNVNLLSIAL